MAICYGIIFLLSCFYGDNANSLMLSRGSVPGTRVTMHNFKRNFKYSTLVCPQVSFLFPHTSLSLSLPSASLSQLVQPWVCLMIHAPAHIPGHRPCPHSTLFTPNNSLPEPQQLRRGLHHLQREADPQPGNQILPDREPVAEVSESGKLDPFSRAGRKERSGCGESPS